MPPASRHSTQLTCAAFLRLVGMRSLANRAGRRATYLVDGADPRARHAAADVKGGKDDASTGIRLRDEGTRGRARERGAGTERRRCGTEKVESESGGCDSVFAITMANQTHKPSSRVGGMLGMQLIPACLHSVMPLAHILSTANSENAPRVLGAPETNLPSRRQPRWTCPCCGSSRCRSSCKAVSAM